MTQAFNQQPPLQSIAAGSTAVSNGFVLDNGAPRANHIAVIVPAGAASAGVVTLQGSLDNVNWYTLIASGALSTANVVTVNIGSFPAQFVRAAITTLVTGTTIGVMVASA